MNTQKVDSKKMERAGGAGGAILAFLLVFGFLASQGCAGPLIFGLKQIKDKDGTEYNFITGADFTIGANGTDSVSNFRGIEPEKYKKP